ncbi:hypothetical protein VIGAN_08011700, partial [Vigna angularis var. angularis]
LSCRHTLSSSAKRNCWKLHRHHHPLLLNCFAFYRRKYSCHSQIHRLNDQKQTQACSDHCDLPYSSVKFLTNTIGSNATMPC